MTTAQALMQILADGHFHSGNEMGACLGCTRSAIWKGVQGLQNGGIEIFSVRGKGYRLVRPVELLAEQRILDSLASEYRPFLNQLDVHFEIDSTNSYLLKESVAPPTGAKACVAEYQFAGRGRRGRRWVSPFGGNLYLSLLWQFSHGAAQLGGFSLAVAVAVTRAVQHIGVADVGLKWPNDILLGGRKLAGILLEITGEAAGPCQVVIGVGVNIRLPAAAREQIDQPCTDLETALGRDVGRNELAGQILGQLIHVSRQYETEGLDAFREEWCALDQFSGQEVVLHSPEGESTGIVQGIDEQGALLLLQHGGGLKRFHSGEVSLRHKRGH